MRWAGLGGQSGLCFWLGDRCRSQSEFAVGADASEPSGVGIGFQINPDEVRADVAVSCPSTLLHA